MPITHISLPSDALKTTLQYDSEGIVLKDQRYIKIERDLSLPLEIENELIVYLKTQDTEKAILIAQKSENHPDQIAIMASFAPNFLENQQDSLTIQEVIDEKPEP